MLNFRHRRPGRLHRCRRGGVERAIGRVVWCRSRLLAREQETLQGITGITGRVPLGKGRMLIIG